ncbi:MAG: hypothetical protein HZB16_00410 [Armatimonadetes bacterium]|nr:hypothetical protein [Armatimonadota bacterium]
MTALMLMLLTTAVAAAPFTSTLLTQPERWTDRMNDPLVGAADGALRVTIAADRKWAIAAVPNVTLSPQGRLRVKVRAISGGNWLVRYYGDVDGTGKMVSVSVHERMTSPGTAEISLDPRLLPGARPVQFQLGIEGKPGDFVEFESVELLPAPNPPTSVVPAGQVDVKAVALMPSLPRPLKIIDWPARARAFDKLAFDLDAKGQWLPLIWLDDARRNADHVMFGLPSYISAEQKGEDHEGIVSLAAVLSGTLVGLDKRAGAHDWVRMVDGYYNRANGEGVVLNRTATGTGGSAWYEIWPGMLFTMLAARHQADERLAAIQSAQADRWAEAAKVLGDKGFEFTAIDLKSMTPRFNGQWREPDASAGLAWLEYCAWRRTGEARHFEAAHTCLDALNARTTNPYYEVMLPWGVQAAARANAETGATYDLPRLVAWCFDPGNARGAWGVEATSWAGLDCHGLVGSITGYGGYAFAMNTFAEAAALTPIVRYDPRFAHAVGKWMLNLTNAARLFYPDQLPAANQQCPEWKGDPAACIAYEGLRQTAHGQSPWAGGDPTEMGWGPKTDLGVYGSAHIGLLAALVGRTNHEAILALDCLATDFWHTPAWPTKLVYNPYADTRQVALPVGEAAVDVYDIVADAYLARGAKGSAHFGLTSEQAAVVVLIPAGTKLEPQGKALAAGGRVVDWRP